MGLPKRTPPWVVPEDLPQIAGKPRRSFFEHRQSGLGVAPRRRHAALRGRELGPSVERLPRPLIPTRLSGSFQRCVERLPGGVLMPRSVSDGRGIEACERLMLAESASPHAAHGIQLASARAPVSTPAPVLVQADLRAEAPRRRASAPRLPPPRRLFVEGSGSRRIARAGRVPPEAEQLGARRSESSPRFGRKLIDGAARSRRTPEVEVEVAAVEQGLVAGQAEPARRPMSTVASRCIRAWARSPSACDASQLSRIVATVAAFCARSAAVREASYDARASPDRPAR